ncbi:MAG: UvrB/UvrC motif-containing protein [Lachnospiraceae bacterium]|nr:UvrB/UvrC motif-containing protein [Lachnospiraceae bacterium]
MLCQRCHKNKATQYYMGDWNGTLFVTGFCPECVDEMARKSVLGGYGEVIRQSTGLYPGKETPRADGAVPFPQHADPELITRVHVNDLKYQLEEAAEREDYTEAARLRDAIKTMSQEESYYES